MTDWRKSSGEIDARKLDWPRIIADLRERDCSVYRAAQLLGTALSTVQSWGYGVEPGHSKGEALLKLHAQVCGPDLTTLRRTEITVYAAEVKA